MNQFRALCPPFDEDRQLCCDLGIKDSRILHTSGRNSLPGQPYVSLDTSEVLLYIEKEFCTPVLDTLGPHLWLLAAPRSSHISALHDQIVRGRQIIISEDPELHLVWIDRRVYIKPIPPYLLSYTFWQYYLTPSGSYVEVETKRKIHRAAVGYLRTWRYLIRHECDYNLALANSLLPTSIKFSEFARFFNAIGAISDEEVSSRYHYGELRLSRLNFWAKIFLFRSYFRKVTWQYSDHFARYYAPILFVFAVFSVVLSAMQVGVGARNGWPVFTDVSAWFSVVTLILTCVTIMVLFVDFAVTWGREMIYALRHRLGRYLGRSRT